MLHRRHPSPVTITITILCAVNKFMSFRHATIGSSESCVLLLITFLIPHRVLFSMCYKMQCANAAESLIFAFHASAYITRFQLPSAKNLFPQNGMCTQVFVVVLGVPSRAEWKTIQDKLSKRIPTIRTLRDSLIKCLNAATKGGGGGVATYIRMPIHIWI